MCIGCYFPVAPYATFDRIKSCKMKRDQRPVFIPPVMYPYESNRLLVLSDLIDFKEELLAIKTKSSHT